MRSGKWTRLIVASALCAGFAVPASAQGSFWGRQRRDERRDIPRREARDDRARRVPGYQEPAFARGYSDGYEDGMNDGRRHNRYDPVGEKDYRQADQGYFKNYGPKDAYRNNYRAGFREGYDDGYRARGFRR